MEKMRTSGLKLSDLRPCDSCEGPLVPFFYVIDIKFALFSPQNVKSVLGTNLILGGNALGIAEAMAPGADEAVVVSEEEGTNHTLFICQNCLLMKELHLAAIAEKRTAQIEEAKRKAEGGHA